MRLSLVKSERNWPEFVRKPKKPQKNHKKPVESGLLLLTKFFESRKVNGGGVFLDPHKHRVFPVTRGRVNAEKETVLGEPEEAAKRIFRWL